MIKKVNQTVTTPQQVDMLDLYESNKTYRPVFRPVGMEEFMGMRNYFSGNGRKAIFSKYQGGPLIYIKETKYLRRKREVFCSIRGGGGGKQFSCKSMNIKILYPLNFY